MATGTIACIMLRVQGKADDLGIGSGFERGAKAVLCLYFNDWNLVCPCSCTSSLLHEKQMVMRSALISKCTCVVFTQRLVVLSLSK